MEYHAAERKKSSQKELLTEISQAVKDKYPMISLISGT